MKAAKPLLVATFAIAALLLAPLWTVKDPPTGVFTWRYENTRTGARSGEAALTPATVRPQFFGKLHSYAVDGAVYAQPLLVSGLKIAGHGRMNVVFVVTQHDSVYAFDADLKNSAPLWHRSFLDRPGVSPVSQNDTAGPISPEVGITSTPVIDPNRLTMYVVAYTKEGDDFVYRLHALDLRTGSEKGGGPVKVAGIVHGKGDGSQSGMLRFDARYHLQRAALLLEGGSVYIAFASHSDLGPFHGWVFAYDAATLRQNGIWVATPDGVQGGIWQSGAGLAADESGAVYLTVGNGTFDANSGGRDYGNSVVKLKRVGPELAVADYFTPYNEKALQENDTDLGSPGPVIVPGERSDLVVVAGKEGRIYLIDSRAMGHGSEADRQILQSIPEALGAPDHAGYRNFSSPAYWNRKLYFVGSGDEATAFKLENDRLSASAISRTPQKFPYPGANPVVTASGDGSAILWAVEFGGANPAVLHAYNADNLSEELFNTEMSAGRDRLGPGVKWAVPIVFESKVFLGGASTVEVLGPLRAAPVAE